MRILIKSGEALLGIIRTLAFPLNESERRILNKEVTGFDLGFNRIMLISKLRIDGSQEEQRERQGAPFGDYCHNPGERECGLRTEWGQYTS